MRSLRLERSTAKLMRFTLEISRSEKFRSKHPSLSKSRRVNIFARGGKAKPTLRAHFHCNRSQMFAHAKSEFTPSLSEAFTLAISQRQHSSLTIASAENTATFHTRFERDRALQEAQRVIILAHTSRAQRQ